MKAFIQKLQEHQSLQEKEAYELMLRIGTGEVNPAQQAAVMMAYNMRRPNLSELNGFRKALLDLAVKVDLPEGELMDVCGTGGDGKNTFNISTLSAFVLSGAGIPVAKHGNYGVSGICGSSTVLEYLGYRFSSDPDDLNTQLEHAGLCFLHAPLFHPALRHVAQARKELGVKTFFNMLGPLVNPAQPRLQVSGVFDRELARTYAYLFQQEEKKFVVLHADDGYDEVSLTGGFRYHSHKGEAVAGVNYFGTTGVLPEQIHAGTDVKSAANIFLNVLKNKATPEQERVVAANAAMGILCKYDELKPEDAFAIALESLRSGRAFMSFNKLVSCI